MKRVILFIFLTLPLLTNASTPINIKSLFIFQFTKLIDWPSETKTGMFRIGVIGSFEAYNEVMDVTIGRNVGSQNIEVMNLMSIDQLSLTDFHILVVGEAFCSTEKLKEINVKLKDTSTLIISTKVNYKGNDVDICFEFDGQKFKYNYAQELIQSKGLKCSRDFLHLGQKNEQLF